MHCESLNVIQFSYVNVFKLWQGKCQSWFSLVMVDDALIMLEGLCQSLTIACLFLCEYLCVYSDIWQYFQLFSHLQGRQKLARFNAHEFATLVIDILSDAKRRQQGSPLSSSKGNCFKSSLLLWPSKFHTSARLKVIK